MAKSPKSRLTVAGRGFAARNPRGQIVHLTNMTNIERVSAPVERQGYLVDNSILQKLSRSPGIKRRFDEITSRYPIFTCPPQVLEYCWSARNKTEYAELRADMELYTPAAITPSQSEILDIQQALWDSGKVRAAGNADVTIAAYAIANDLTVLCNDHDFELIAKALGPGVLKVEFVAE